MTKNNELAPVTYETDSGELTITPDDVRTVIAGNQQVTDKEVRLFLELCKSQRLNPFIREAYLIKYGSSAATIVTGKDVFLKRAQRNPKFMGLSAGLTIIGIDGGLHHREGSMILKGEELVGAWCKVFVSGYQAPIYDEVSYTEYVATRWDDKAHAFVPNKQWKSKPGTMLRKVAVVHALREAFPDDFQGLYDEAEMGNLEPPEPTEPAEPTVAVRIPVYEEGQASEGVTYEMPEEGMEEF